MMGCNAGQRPPRVHNPFLLRFRPRARTEAANPGKAAWDNDREPLLCEGDVEHNGPDLEAGGGDRAGANSTGHSMARCQINNKQAANILVCARTFF